MFYIEIQNYLCKQRYKQIFLIYSYYHASKRRKKNNLISFETFIGSCVILICTKLMLSQKYYFLKNIITRILIS